MAYSELEGFPPQCTNSSYVFDTLEVRQPYGPINEALVVQEPLVPGRMDYLFQGPVHQDIVGKAGWDSADERELLKSMKQLAGQLYNNTAFYPPTAKNAIVSLARSAHDLLEQIPSIYRVFENYSYPIQIRGTTTARKFPLSVPDGEIAFQLVPSFVEANPSWREQRENARKAVRERWYKAMRLIWCAEYGANLALALKDNRETYYQRYKKTEGFGLKAAEDPPTVIDIPEEIGPEDELPGPPEPPEVSPEVPSQDNTLWYLAGGAVLALLLLRR